MSKYTTLVKNICESYANESEPSTFANVHTVINKAIPKVFDSFPIYNENHRNILCSKILKHYYMREICCETVGQWKLYLNTKMFEIMPYYNELYKSIELEYNPLDTINITRSGNENVTGKNTDIEVKNVTDKTTKKSEEHNQEILNGSNDITRNSTTSNGERFSDTPQNGLTDLVNDKYLTTATLNNGSTNGTEKTTTNSTNTQNNTSSSDDNRNLTDNTSRTNDLKNDKIYSETITGKNSNDSYSKLIIEYRKAIINVDMMIINELEDLFFKLW